MLQRGVSFLSVFPFIINRLGVTVDSHPKLATSRVLYCSLLGLYMLHPSGYSYRSKLSSIGIQAVTSEHCISTVLSTNNKYTSCVKVIYSISQQQPPQCSLRSTSAAAIQPFTSSRCSYCVALCACPHIVPPSHPVISSIELLLLYRCLLMLLCMFA